jgi:hypothetical protein
LEWIRGNGLDKQREEQLCGKEDELVAPANKGTFTAVSPEMPSACASRLTPDLASTKFNTKIRRLEAILLLSATAGTPSSVIGSLVIQL